LLFCLLALWGFDALFKWPPVWRGVAMLLAAGVVAWLVARELRALISRETFIDWALFVERRHRLDCELVAALQFDSGAAATTASSGLKATVIHDALSLADQLDYRHAVSWDQARRAGGRAATVALLASALALAFPEHARVFAKRLLLGPDAYPTRTRIVRVAVNGRDLPFAAGGELPTSRVLAQTPTAVSVHCQGRLPEAGTLMLRGLATGDFTTLALRPGVAQSRSRPGTSEYAVASAALHEPVEYTIRLGDAEPLRGCIELLQQPIVEVLIEVIPPPHARHLLETAQYRDLHLRILEGSAVNLLLRSANHKRLVSAMFAKAGDDATDQQSFAPADQEGYAWRLEAFASTVTPLRKDVSFTVNVVDEDGLSTAQPLRGSIQWQPDEPPTATLSTIHRAIVSHAQPTFAFYVSDDFAIGQLLLHATRQREGETSEEAQRAPQLSVPIPLPHRPLLLTDEPHRGQWRLDPGPLELREGDRLMVTLEAFDYRGEWLGVSARSEPVELPVVNDRAVLETILQADGEAERLLTEAIDHELGVVDER